VSDCLLNVFSSSSTRLPSPFIVFQRSLELLYPRFSDIEVRSIRDEGCKSTLGDGLMIMRDFARSLEEQGSQTTDAALIEIKLV
jgi:hypothetical protein